jgi:hypothetical protein
MAKVNFELRPGSILYTLMSYGVDDDLWSDE